MKKRSVIKRLLWNMVENRQKVKIQNSLRNSSIELGSPYGGFDVMLQHNYGQGEKKLYFSNQLSGLSFLIYDEKADMYSTADIHKVIGTISITNESIDSCCLQWVDNNNFRLVFKNLTITYGYFDA